MNIKSLSERDICTKYITPAIENAGWDKMGCWIGAYTLSGNEVPRMDENKYEH